MATATMRLGLDQRRAFAAPCTLNSLTGSPIHIQGVRTIGDDTGNPIARRACRNIYDVHHGDGRRELAVMVVLANKDHREFKCGSQVHRLVETAFVRRAVTKETHGNSVRFAIFGAHSSANRNRNTTADDPAGTDHSDLEIGDVLATALTLAGAGSLAE